MAQNARDNFTPEEALTVSEILKAVGHPVRLGVIDNLAGEEMCVGDLAERIGKPQAIVSQQLKILRLMGLVETERRGGKTYYRLKNLHLLELLGCMKRCVCGEVIAKPTKTARSVNTWRTERKKA